MTPESLAKAQSQLEAAGTAAFSFDIFDTILLRRCTDPTGVYERAFQLAPIPADRRMCVESFIQNRQLAEHKARQRKWHSGRGTEATIEEIYAEFPVHSMGLPMSARPLLAAAEFDAELDLCFLNRDVYAVYQAARARGLRAGFISDTYWSRDQLERLLRHVAPDLQFDFLYSSCEFGMGKAGGLLHHYLQSEGLAAAQAVHLGDNPVADIAAANQLGMRAIHYPQMSAPLFEIFQQEVAAAQLIGAQRPGTSRRLDGGLAALRRLATADLPADAGCHAFVGSAVLGPVLTGFQRFIERRVAELRAEGRRVEVLFMARDGYLPFRLWNGSAERANYVEINRRIALVGSSDGFEALQMVVGSADQLDEKFLTAYLKEDLPAVSEYIRRQPGQVISGAELASRLPELIGPDKMRELSRSMRQRLLGYLRQTVFDFDACTDLVLVDVGYFGTSQRALRGLFDREGLEKRIHGVYLMTIDYQFSALDPRDSVSGFLDDSLLSPQAKLMLQRNVAVLEQLLSAPVGSVSNYDGAAVQREDDYRSRPQLQFCSAVQDYCGQFFDAYRAKAAAFGCDPLADVEAARLWSAVVLSRFLLMPSSAERKVFGQLQHDVNSFTVTPMVDAAEVETLLATMTWPDVFALREPPMWLSASLSAVSPSAGYLYALSGFGFAADAALADTDLGTLDANLIKGSEGIKVPVTCTLTGFRELRLRIPVLQKHSGSVVALLLKGPLRRGTIRSLTLQDGPDSAHALRNRNVQALPVEQISGLKAQVSCGYFEATEADGHLLLAVPPFDQPLSILTLTVSPLLPGGEGGKT